MSPSERERRLTANWLDANAQIYRSPDRIQPDVLAVLDRIPTLRPKTEIYTYDDGRTQLLLCLHGTLPITYRAATYNIPVAIWLTLDYPREPPIVYVVPTNDMLVRQSVHVDLSGRCDLQYMRDWRVKSDSCSVQGLIDAMADYFSSQPPLYARPRSQDTSLPRARSSSPAAASRLSSDHDRVGHVLPPGRGSVPPPLPRKPQDGSPESSFIPSVGVGPRPSPEHQQPTSPPSLSYPYAHAPLPGSQSQSHPQTSHILSQTPLQIPPAIPPHPQAPGAFNYPLQPAPAPIPLPAAPAPSSSPAVPDRPPPVPPLPAGIPVYGQHIRGASASGSISSLPGSNSALGASPPPYYYSPGPGIGIIRPGGQEVGIQAIQQHQGQVIQQQRHLQLQQQHQPRVATPTSPPPPPPVPPSPFHVPQRQQELRQEPRFTTYEQAQAYGYGSPPVLSPQQAQTQGYTPEHVGGQQATLPQQYTGHAIAAYSYTPAAPILKQQPPQPTRVPPPDLLSSDEDGEDGSSPAPPTTQPFGAPAPPRPPNPELQRLHGALHALVRASLAQLQASCTEAQAKQLELQRALLAGAPAVEDESARLVAVRDVCRGVGARLKDVVSRTEGVVAEVKRRGEVGVDEMVCATSIVGNQLINLVAEDNAIEDTMYHLHSSLNTGRIDLERFLRTTRVLAEEQFMKRALVEKIQKGLPMGMSIHA